MASSVVEKRIGGEPLTVDPGRDALLLDIDGTLLDIVPHHDAVVVPETLRTDLARLNACFAGALALVSGRAMATIDRLFSPLQLPAIGCHGAEFRPDPKSGGAITRSPAIGAALKQKIMALKARYPRIVIEDKSYSIALHYRGTPEIGEELEAIAREIAADGNDPPLSLLLGKCVVEIKPSAIGKGEAVKELLAVPPFRGRRAVFLGDDVTDEAVFAILGGIGGVGISVGRPMKGADYILENPRAVRQWLSNLTGRPECLH
jgi:trehalose 6-phosphate phosphatase